MIGLLVILGLLANCAIAFRSLGLSTKMRATNQHVTNVYMNANSLELLYNSLASKLESTFDLKATDFTAVQEAETFSATSADGSHLWQGASTWLSEQKGSKLTGVAKNFLKESSEKSHRYNIDAWLGPGYMVPHMTLSFGADVTASGETYSIRTDYIPRGPFPFGSDASYLDSFYKHEMGPLPSHREFHNESPKLSFNHRLLHSPIYFSGNKLPLDLVTSLATEHLDRWLGFMANAKPLEARQKAGYNTRDDKLRQFAFAAHLNEYSAKFGKETGRKLAAAFTGPLAEAYVGGGS